MSKVTGKLQITLPKQLATRFDIKVGDEVELVASGDAIVLTPMRDRELTGPRDRLRLFDCATERQASRERLKPPAPAHDRGWTRDELYSRARTR